MSTSILAVGSATQTNYPVLVNGYLCFSAAEVQDARSFVNPHKTAGTSSAEPNYPVMVNGYLCFDSTDVRNTRNFFSMNRPLASGSRGTQVNILA